jgi:hypothetical protein
LLDGGDMVAETRPVSPAIPASPLPARSDAPHGPGSRPGRTTVTEARRLGRCERRRSPTDVRGDDDRARTPHRQGEDPVLTPTTVEEMGAC